MVVSLPPGLGLYRATPPAGCGYNTSSRRLTCTFGSIAVNATSTVRIDLKSFGAAPGTEQVQVAASVSGEPIGATSDNTDAMSTYVGSFTPTLGFPTSQALYLCIGNSDLPAVNCLATDAVYGSHGTIAFDATGTARLTIALAAATLAGGARAQTAPDMSVQFTGPTELELGRPDHFRLSVTNNGSAVAPTVSSTMTFPPGADTTR